MIIVPAGMINNRDIRIMTDSKKMVVSRGGSRPLVMIMMIGCCCRLNLPTM